MSRDKGRFINFMHINAFDCCISEIKIKRFDSLFYCEFDPFLDIWSEQLEGIEIESEALDVLTSVEA